MCKLRAIQCFVEKLTDTQPAHMCICENLLMCASSAIKFIYTHTLTHRYTYTYICLRKMNRSNKTSRNISV